MTLILQSEEIKKIVHLNSELIPIIENAFKSLSEGQTVMPPILRLDIKKYHGESDVKAAYIEGLDSFAIKVASGFFNNPSLGLPSSNGLMILLDSETGILKSVLLDKGYLTDVRTAIAGAIASKYLSNPEIETAGIMGVGIQAKLQLQALMLVRKPTNAYIWGRDKRKTSIYIEAMKKKLKINFHQCLTFFIFHQIFILILRKVNWPLETKFVDLRPIKHALSHRVTAPDVDLFCQFLQNASEQIICDRIRLRFYSEIFCLLFVCFLRVFNVVRGNCCGTYVHQRV